MAGLRAPDGPRRGGPLRDLGQHASQGRLFLPAGDSLLFLPPDHQHEGRDDLNAEALGQVGPLADIDLHHGEPFGVQSFDDRHHHLAGAARGAVEVVEHILGSGSHGSQTEHKKGRVHAEAPERCKTQQMRNRLGKIGRAEPAGRQDVRAK